MKLCLMSEHRRLDDELESAVLVGSLLTSRSAADYDIESDVLLREAKARLTVNDKRGAARAKSRARHYRQMAARLRKQSVKGG